MENFAMTDIGSGLSEAEARTRLQKFGPNEFEKKKGFSIFSLILSQFTSPLVYVLVIAAVMKIVLRDWVDTAIIGLVVIVNAGLGFWQEYKAATSLEALKSYLKPVVTVLRGGKKMQIAMKELVVGDICLLSSGESVPADGVLVDASEMVVNESILTGESRSVYKTMMEKLESNLKMPAAQDKHAEKFVYMGTSVAAGIGTMLVLATGKATEMGKIASKLAVVEESDTPLQQKMKALAKMLVIVVVVATVLIVLIGLWRERELGEMIEMGVAMAVAAIPEGLVISMTVILALGMQRILQKKALVRKLVAAETLGGVSVICSDKTGTLTQGKMQIVEYVGDRDEIVRAAILANDGRDEEAVAMLGWAKNELENRKVAWTKLTSVEEIKRKMKRVFGIPFSSERKFTLSVNVGGSNKFATVAGAPEKIMAMCEMPAKKRKEEEQKIAQLASSGYRLIGLAGKKIEGEGKLVENHLDDFEWAGVLVFEDPVREEVKNALREAAAAGVKVKVITGDYKETAVAVLSKLFDGSIKNEQVVTGEELRRLSGKNLADKIEESVLFARTSPDQKLIIVEHLKKRGEVVAMTGDGVNDAPALAAADIGVVVNEATDVSKETADMVLLDSNFGTIVEAIRQGRMIFATMRKVVTYLVSTSFQEIVLIGGSLLLNLPLPLTAAQILWINLVQDGMPGLALAFDMDDDGVMAEKPRKRKGSILDREAWSLTVAIGLISNLFKISVFYYFFSIGYTEINLRSMMFAIVGINTLVFIFSIKSLKRNIWNQKLFDNKFLLISVVLGFGLMLLSLNNPWLMRLLELEPLTAFEWAVVFVVNFLSVVMVEVVKYVFIRERSDKKSENGVGLAV